MNLCMVYVLKILILVYVINYLEDCINGLEVIPERCALTYTNPKYVNDVEVTVRRYSRKSPYVLNIRGTTLQPWANNVTVKFIFYEYLHNEYRHSFVEMSNKLCDLIYKDPFVSPVLQKLKIVCPLPAGIQNLPNMTLISVPAVDNMPYKWPFEKGKIEAVLSTFPEKELIAQGYGIATFLQTTNIKRKKKNLLKKKRHSPI